MKVILLQQVDRLGDIGDVVTVSDGYARNYLLPQKKASLATEGNVKLQEALKKKKEAAEVKRRAEAQTLAEKVGAMSVTISAEAGEEEKLFGSVSTDMIARALTAEGVAVDKRAVILEDPIKKLGVYQVEVKIHPEVKATVRVWVVKKEAEKHEEKQEETQEETQDESQKEKQEEKPVE